MVSTAVVNKFGLGIGTPVLSSPGAIVFGPEGILFVADHAAATIFAIEVADRATASAGPIEITDLDTRIGSLLGTGPDDVHIAGLAVHPDTRAVYLSVTRGHGSGAVPLLAGPGRRRGSRSPRVELTDVPFARSSDWMTHRRPDDERQDVLLNPRGRGQPDPGHPRHYAAPLDQGFVAGRRLCITDMAPVRTAPCWWRERATRSSPRRFAGSPVFRSTMAHKARRWRSSMSRTGSTRLRDPDPDVHPPSMATPAC